MFSYRNKKDTSIFTEKKKWFFIVKYFRTSNQAVAEQKIAEEELAEEVDTANIRMDEINSEMGSILDQLGEAKVRNHS